MATKPTDREMQQQRKDGLRAPRAYDVDRAWQGYVAGLAVEDDRGAFLLPDELPGPGASPEEVRYAIQTATRRAFLGHREPADGPRQSGSRSGMRNLLGALRRFFQPAARVQVIDVAPGILTGELRMLLPQGRETTIEFNQEPGWRADVVISGDSVPFHGVFYYRSLCMNPVRAAVARGAEIDASQVYFEPLDRGRVQAILSDQGQDRLTVSAVRRLQAEYRLYRSWMPGTPFA